jgi:hypothetical protein
MGAMTTATIERTSASGMMDRARRRGFSPARVYRESLAGSPRRERMFIGSVGFFAGFGGARAVTHAIRRGVGPFRNLSVGGRHLHHMVFGIGGLLGTGYLWLLLVGTDPKTVDQFALWLNLQDVYWAKQGRESVDAAAVFGGLLSIGAWGAPLFRGLIGEMRKLRP